MTHRWAQVFYLQLTHGVVTVNDLKTIADGIDGLWNTNVKSLVPATVTMDSVSVVFIPSAGNETRYDGQYSRTGTNTNAAVNDASAAYVVRWAISAYYRGGHPRSYLPGVSSVAITNGSTIDATTASAVATAMNAFRNGINALTSTNISATVMGTLSFQTAKAWRVTPLFREFTSVSCSRVLGSQRRRIHS